MKPILKYLGILLMVSFVTGCAVSKAVEESPLTARLIVSQGVMRYIENREDWTSTAQRVIAAAEAARATAGKDVFTLAQLRTAAIDAADLESLNPADRSLALALIDTVGLVVEKRLEERAVEGLDELTSLDQVFEWAISAAQTYVQ